MASIPLVTALLGLLASMYATGFFFFPNLDLQSGSKNLVAVQAPPLDAVVQTTLLTAAAAMCAFNAAVALIYARLHNAGAGAAGRIPQVVYFVACASLGILLVFLVPHPAVAIDGAHRDLLLPLAAAAVRTVLRPAAAAATFFLSVTLIYAHVVRAGGGGDGDGGMPIPIVVEILTKLVLAAALVTVAFTLTSTVLASYAD